MGRHSVKSTALRADKYARFSAKIKIALHKEIKEAEKQAALADTGVLPFTLSDMFDGTW